MVTAGILLYIPGPQCKCTCAWNLILKVWIWLQLCESSTDLYCEDWVQLHHRHSCTTYHLPVYNAVLKHILMPSAILEQLSNIKQSWRLAERSASICIKIWLTRLFEKILRFCPSTGVLKVYEIWIKVFIYCHPLKYCKCTWGENLTDWCYCNDSHQLRCHFNLHATGWT